MKKCKLNKLVGDWKPWDYSYNLEVEREMFRKQSEYFNKSNIAKCDKDTSKKCKLLVNLLDIIMNNDDVLKLIEPFKFIEKDGYFTTENNAKWELVKYINIKNAYRFFNSKELELIDLSENVWKHELRIQKAWYLYHTLRIHFMKSIWN